MKDKVNRLNSLYVGFTRPEEELYVIGVRGKNKGYPLDLPPEDEYVPSDKPAKRPREETRVSQPFDIRHFHPHRRYDVSACEMINLEERQRGEFIHRVLFFVDYAAEGYEEGLLASIRRVNIESGSDYSEEEIKKTVIGLIEDEQMAEYFRQRPGRTVRREQDFSDGDGRLYRMDRVIIDSDRITVVDYKTGREDDALERYQAR